MGKRVRKARLFRTGGSQAVRLPAEFRFAGDSVYAVRDEATGDVTLTQRPAAAWRELFELIHAVARDEGVSEWMTERPLNRPLREAGVFDDERD